jgi:flagellar assembly factor FliW
VSVIIKTKPFGEIAIEEKQIIDFPDGVFGFEDFKQFAILDDSHSGSPFRWLQAMNEPDLAFVIILIADVMADYELVVPDSDYELLGVKSPNELLVFSIITIPENYKMMTANLMGPVLVNPVKKIGRQSISLCDKYGVRHRVIEGMKRVD